jgi:hypothetical protein
MDCTIRKPAPHPQHFCRHTCCDSVCRYISGHNSTRANDRTFADGDTGQDNAAHTDVCAVAD